MGTGREGGLGRTWGSPLSRKRCWQGFLLAASIPMICGQNNVSVLVHPSGPVPEGQSVRLSPQIFAGFFQKCQWRRGAKVILSQEGMPPYLFETGEAYSGRESVGLDCSLSIRGVRKGDAGFYTVLIDRGGASTARGDATLLVSDPETSTWDETAWNYNKMVIIVVAVFMSVLLVGAGLLIFFCVRFQRLKRSRHVAVIASPAPPPSAPLPSAPPPYENVCPYGPPPPWTLPYRVQPGEANQEQRNLQAAHPLP